MSRLALAAVSTFALAASAAACNNTPPAPPQGAADVQFASSNKCQVHSEELTIGSVSSSTKLKVIADGLEGVTVDCEVKGTTSFSVFGDIRQGGRRVTISIDSIDKKATKAAPAKGNVTYASATTAGATYSSQSDAPCNFYLLPGEVVASGTIWVAFSCESVTQEMSTCSIDESFIILENCQE